MTNETNIATTIFDQLGGMNRIAMMTGAKNFGYSTTDEGNVKASFSFKGSRKVNGLEITLTNDTYTVTFSKTTAKTGYNVIETSENVYGDNLTGMFETRTGLSLRI